MKRKPHAAWDAFTTSLHQDAQRTHQDLNGLRLELAADSQTLMIICAGRAPVGHDGYAFELAPSKISAHKLYLYDRKNRWYYSGIEGVTASFEETLDLIETLISQINPTLSCAVGTSAGGYMALAIAALLGFDRALALAPQSTLSQSWNRLNKDSRWEGEIAAIHRSLNGLVPFDIQHLISTIASGTEFHVIYPLGEPLDALHAHRLEGYAHTFLYAMDSPEHNVASPLYRTGRLARLVNAFAAPQAGSVQTSLQAIVGRRSVAS